MVNRKIMQLDREKMLIKELQTSQNPTKYLENNDSTLINNKSSKNIIKDPLEGKTNNKHIQEISYKNINTNIKENLDLPFNLLLEAENVLRESKIPPSTREQANPITYWEEQRNITIKNINDKRH